MRFNDVKLTNDQIDKLLIELGMGNIAESLSEIEAADIFGDSLTDFGNMNDDELMRMISMSHLSGLSGKSIHGAFTDGWPWVMTFFQLLAGEEITLENPNAVQTTDDKTIIARSYAKGGATADEWDDDLCINPALLGARQMLTNFKTMVDMAEQEDRLLEMSPDEKKRRLQFIFLGANDLATVNNKACLEASQKAAHAIIAQMERRLKSGYPNQVVFTLPGLEKTPRYARLAQEGDEGRAESERMRLAVENFNTLVKEGISHLNTKYDLNGANIKVFDMHALFKILRNNPEAFGLDSKLWNEPLTETEAFKEAEDKSKVESGKRPMWDDVHPGKVMQKLMGYILHRFVVKNFKYVSLHRNALEMFQRHFAADLRRNPPWCCATSFDYAGAQKLSDVIYHGLFEDGVRTLRILQELQWIKVEKTSSRYCGSGEVKYTCCTTNVAVNKAFEKAIDMATNSLNRSVRAMAMERTSERIHDNMQRIFNQKPGSGNVALNVKVEQSTSATPLLQNA